MIALANAEESAKRHHGIGDAAGIFVHHQAVDRAEMLALPVINGGARHFIGGNQPTGLIGGDAASCSLSRVARHIFSFLASIDSVAGHPPQDDHLQTQTVATAQRSQWLQWSVAQWPMALSPRVLPSPPKYNGTRPTSRPGALASPPKGDAVTQRDEGGFY
jgi:hypothetical protein